MAKRAAYKPGRDVLASEALGDSRGRLIDDDYVDAAVEDARRQVRGRGRPSLSEAGESPLLRVRLPRDLDEAIRQAAQDAGTTRSEWVRRVLAGATRKG
jgi:hypothetical protein